MQEREFDKLIDGKPAKWAEMSEPKLKEWDEMTKGFKLSLIPGETKSKIRSEIKEKETPIPKEISDAIHKFVKEEREKKTSERAIRRAVKRKWNIYVV
jgi:hypothetical protein